MFDTSDPLESLASVSEEELRKIVLHMSNATCQLDPIPTVLLKQCLDELLPNLVKIVNLSLQDATVPPDLKTAIVKPLLKKMSLNPDEFKNYRPVSNLSFLSKIIEKVVAIRLDEYLSRNNLTEPMQSAYRKYHSTETALLCIQNDLLCGLDKKAVTALVLLDLSAAFDTISHSILLSRLEKRYAIRGRALQWFKSYLMGRGQCVKIGVNLSKRKVLSYGVPQGSILGPILFTLYTAPLGDIARKEGVGHHFYADDSQLYFSLKSNSSIETLERCIQKYRTWMIANDLKINDSKTEIVVIASRQNLSKTSSLALHVGENTVKSSDAVNNLGVIFDSTLSMKNFVNNKCSTCMFYLKSIAKIRKFLTVQATQSLVQALVVSRLDYCNSLLYGISKQNINKLQKVQNAAARLIVRKRRYDHIRPTLMELHMLPIEFRIKFKILVNVFNAYSGNSPNYLSKLIKPCVPSRSLRSSSKLLLQEKKLNNSFGSRAFSNCGPKLFNSLPEQLKKSPSVEVFKRGLKTILFKQAFSDLM